jgi:hypothetical protein
VPVIAFRERKTAEALNDVYVQKLVGTSWVTVGHPLNPTAQEAGQSNLALDAKDRPIVSVTQAGECYVMRANKL